MLYAPTHRPIYGKLVLDMLGTMFERYGLGGTLGGSVEAVVIGLSAAIASHEGQHLSDYKLAEITGVPRRTVSRKMREMVDRGLFHKVGTRYYLNPQTYVDTPENREYEAKLVKLIKDAAETIAQCERERERTRIGKVVAREQAILGPGRWK
jgi:hypothetical protein